MAKSSLTVEMKAKERQLVDAMKKIERLSASYEQRLTKLTGTSQKAGEAQKKFGRDAKRAFEEIRGPQERYDRKMRALNHLVERGAITQREYGLAAKQAGEKMARAGRSGRSAFGPRALSQVKQLAGALGLTAGAAGGVGVAIALVKAEFQALLEVQRRAKETSQTVGQAQIGALRNLGADTPAQRDAFSK